jgi:hypothetical protein
MPSLKPALSALCPPLCLLLVAGEASGQGSRFPAPRVDLGAVVSDSVVVDIDADGLPDLIAGASGLRVRRGLGDGTFGPLETYSAGNSPRGFSVVDVDLDGDLDVVACRNANGAGPKDLIVIRQKPDHTFGPLTSYPVEGPWDTAAGDLNGDGWPDLVVTNWTGASQEFQVRLATAPGVFGASTSVPLLLETDDVVLADFDLDGQLDLATDCPSAAVVAVLIGDGAGGFSKVATYPIGPDSYSLRAADLDADGALDLVVGQDELSGEFDILYGLGDGSFEPHVAIDSGFIYPRETAIADIDRDGVLDLAVDTGYEVALLFGLGNREYAEPVAHTIGGSSHSALHLADLDRDGWLDLVVDNLLARDATVLRSLGDGDFGSADLYEGPSTFYPGVAVADFNGDGVLDVFATNEWTNLGTTWLGDGDGGFTAGPTMAVPDVSWSAVAGLLDGDDVLDLLVSDRATDSVQLFIGQGDGSFIASQVVATGGDMPGEAALADLDHDGDLDAVVANVESKSLAMLVGNGDGTFTLGDQLGSFAGGDLRNLAIADVTGDGHPDIVMAPFTGGFFQLIPGTGSASFSGWGTTYDAGSSVADLALVDVNGDGRVDLLLSDTSGNTLRVNRNDGNPVGGYFDPATVMLLSPTDGGSATLAVADFDLDGALDIAVGMGGAQRIDLLFGNGAGGFSFLPGESYAVSETGNFIRAGDWDQDGAPDLLAVAQKISVLHNGTLDPWKTLGQGSPGIDGIPWLHGEGSPSAGQPVSLRIEHGHPSTPVALIAGLTALMAPFKGGTLMPQPSLILTGLFTNPAGELTLSGSWPAIPGHPQLYLQAWLVDEASPTGLAGSGALRVTDQ